MYKYKLVFSDRKEIKFNSEYYIAYLPTFFINEKAYIHFPDADVFISLTNPPIVKVNGKPYNLPIYKMTTIDDNSL